jgi:hypothetical protein
MMKMMSLPTSSTFSAPCFSFIAWKPEQKVESMYLMVSQGGQARELWVAVGRATRDHVR